ncbi:ABC transporter [Streptomyces sp. SDr-06]|uniref:ABC transporter permease n=1 Tax=Streptomyces sp. SDr-06 TaxID=2267702 RepID=UPI000DEBF157|nr:ABC transporter permease [Streptomyces sp. SDr-06]RCH66626.1 ABC transporter [Streptomyces sp. SDr-06]
MTAPALQAPDARSGPGRPGAPDTDHDGTSSLRHEVRAIHALVHRDLLRLASQPVHTALMLVQPVIYLFILGGGLAALIPTATLGVGYQAYLFPGVLMMTVQTPTIMVGIRLITDRQSGYLRELLMAPVRRPALLLGTCAGGTLVSTAQGALLLALVGAIGLPYDPLLLALLLAAMILCSFTLTALSLTLAVCLSRPEIFNMLLGLVMMPLVLFSGGFFPIANLPGWAHTVAAANPLAYGVDLLRRCIALRVPGQAAGAGVQWSSYQPPLLLEGALLLTLGIMALLWAAHVFSRPE